MVNFFVVYKLIISLEKSLKAADGAENDSASIIHSKGFNFSYKT